jgi:hypothetical protein
MYQPTHAAAAPTAAGDPTPADDPTPAGNTTAAPTAGGCTPWPGLPYDSISQPCPDSSADT